MDKGRNIEYSVKLPSLLNFIFNENLKRIFELETILENLEKEVKKLELKKNQYEFIVKEINNNIIILNLNMQYNGKNAELVKQRLEQYKLMEKDTKSVAINAKNTTELSLMLENIDEQLKTYVCFHATSNLVFRMLNRSLSKWNSIWGKCVVLCLKILKCYEF